MRLLRLKFEAFGPFSGSESVDFRALQTAPLFLIHGPVGSGKTFLLDGVCFALYGRSSGGERERRELRHVGAREDQETVVTLDFRCHGENYRVERRFAASGDEEVVLWRLPRLSEPSLRDVMSSTRSGVEEIVIRLLGLTADQFCQVAILPQGRFRQFLLADGAERRKVLSNIFSSQDYQHFVDELGKACEQARAELESSWADREELVARYRGSDGDPREALNRSLEDLERVEERCGQFREKSVEWERSLEEAVRYEMMERQREASSRELRTLTGGEKAEEDELTGRLRQSLGRYLKWTDLCAESDSLQVELTTQKQQYDELRRGSNFLEEEVERARQIEEERFELHRQIEKFEALLKRQDEVQLLEDELQTSSGRLRELADHRGELALIVKEDRERIVELEEEIKRIDAAEVKLHKLKGELDTLLRAENRVRRREMLEESYKQALSREERYAILVEQLREEHALASRKLARQKEMTLSLALEQLKGRLTEGSACPLCGSLDHPRPFSGAIGGDPDWNQAEEEMERLLQRLQLAEAELSQAKERKARLEGRMAEGEDDQESTGTTVDQETLSTLRAAVAAASDRVSTRDTLERELRRLLRSSKPDRSKLRKMRLLKERLESTHEMLHRRHQETVSDVMDAATELDVQFAKVRFDRLWELLERGRERLDERLSELETATFQTQRAELMAETFALQLAETRAIEREMEALIDEAALIQRGLLEEFRFDFADWDALSFALARTAREANLMNQEAVLDRETLMRAVRRQLEQSQELLATLPVPEMKAAKLRDVLAREREQLESYMEARAALRESVEHSTEDVRRYDDLVETIREREARWSSLDRMMRLASGREGVSFHDWYLSRIFDRVLTAANRRLEILAPNRFCLGLEEDLAVKVIDFVAAKERSATTLSGGESFLASLALALGLGDVLQVDRGARERLQTLFIDEGFGYLDRIALEGAMECLESLKQEGRTVGVISHLPTLRERIRAQIAIAPSDSPLPQGVERIQVFSN